MSLLPIPRGVYPSVTDIDPRALAGKGIRLVLADLDNTLVPYKVTQPPPEIVAWKEALEAEGIVLFLLSNSRKPGRAQRFAEQLGIPYQGHSGKPKRAGYLRAMERMGAKPEETVMVGDQIFTDTLGANNAGVTPYWSAPSGWRATRGGTSGTPLRPPSVFWGGGNLFYERQIRPGGQQRQLLQGS